MEFEHDPDRCPTCGQQATHWPGCSNTTTREQREAIRTTSAPDPDEPGSTDEARRSDLSEIGEASR